MKGHAILPFHEFYRSIKGTMPSGELWEAYKSLLLVNGSMYRMLTLPPGAPRDAVDALRAAVVKLAADKAYIAEANKLMGDVPQYVTNPRLKMTSAPPCRSIRRSRRSWTPMPSGRQNSQRSRRIISVPIPLGDFADRSRDAIVFELAFDVPPTAARNPRCETCSRQRSSRPSSPSACRAAAAQDTTDQQLGQVRFETSCNEVAQRRFDRAMRYQHSFWYRAAIEIFEETLKADPTCAIAYWGIALACGTTRTIRRRRPISAPALAAIQKAQGDRRQDPARARLHRCAGAALYRL